MLKCKTCQLLARRDRGEAPLWDSIQRTEFWDVAHSYNTDLLGWLVLIPRRHIEAVDALTDAESVALGRHISQLSRALKATTGCAKTYIVQFAESPDHPHVHFHIIPRMADQPDDRKGPRVFGYLNTDSAERVTESEMNALAVKIRDFLQTES